MLHKLLCMIYVTPSRSDKDVQDMWNSIMFNVNCDFLEGMRESILIVNRDEIQTMKRIQNMFVLKMSD